MKKLVMLVLMASVLGVVSVSKAADPNMPQRPHFDPNSFRGRIAVTKDADGVITSVKLENRKRGTYNIVLDEKGKELGEKMADKFVSITGKETSKDGEKWLTVETYTEMQRPQGRRGPGDPNRPRGPRRGPDQGGE